MAIENSVPAHAEQVAHVVNTICTRTLNHFAEEAKTNGESLKDAFERYEIDYAWHVLASDRMRERTVAALQAKHQCVVTDVQKAGIADILQSAAAAQPAELLMSFDNELPESLADYLCAAWTTPPSTPTASAS